MRRSASLIALAAVFCAAAAGCTKGASSDQNASSAGSAAPTTGGQMASAQGDPAHGKQIFVQNCAACHGADGGGGVGPSLKGEKARKDTAAAIAWIKDPKPPMPKLFPSPLSEKDVDDVAAFVETL